LDFGAVIKPLIAEDGSTVPTTNIGLWGGSNGPVYEPKSVRLWSAYFLDVSLLCVLLVGLADPRIVKIETPTEAPYLVFLDRLLKWHKAPPPVVQRIGRFLFSGSDAISDSSFAFRLTVIRILNLDPMR